MVAFGVGELTGIITGLSVGSSWVETLKFFFGMLTAAILFYGVWYWNDRLSSSDAVKTFSDFVKIAVWFIYVSVVSYLFFSTTAVKLDFYPAYVDKDAITKGIQVVLPGGKKSIVDVDRPYISLTLNNVPFLYQFLEFPDALESLLITRLILSADKSGWDGHYAHSPDVRRIFSKCVFNALSQVSSRDAVRWICYRGQNTGSLWDYFTFGPLSPFAFLYKGGLVGTRGICKGINLGGSISTIDNGIKSCLRNEFKKFTDYFSERMEQLKEAYKDKKISKAVYEQKYKELTELRHSWEKFFDNVTDENNYEILASAYAKNLIERSEEAPIPRSAEGGDLATGIMKKVYDWIGITTTQAFVGEYLLLDLFEAYQKFFLVIELGFVLPVLLLLSMFPDNSPTGSKVGLALKGFGIYFLIKLSRVAVFLIYLIAHNYFISHVLSG